MNNNINYSNFRSNLSAMLDKVVKDKAPLFVTRQQGETVVVLSLEDFNSYKETLYLLSNRVNVEHLQQSIEQAKKGEKISFNMDELDKLDALECVE